MKTIGIFVLLMFFSFKAHGEMMWQEVQEDFAVSRETADTTNIRLKSSFQWNAKTIILLAEKTYAFKNSRRPEEKFFPLSGEVVRLSPGPKSISEIFFGARRQNDYFEISEIVSGFFLVKKF